MREIKFRAWNKEYGRWATHEELLAVVPVKASILAPSTLTVGKEDSVWEFVQYTGLKDKNGKEIYEGDIVKRYAEVNPSFGFDLTIVQWNPCRCYFELERANDSSDYCGRLDGNTAKDGRYEVIGNIYESPELLTQRVCHKEKSSLGRGIKRQE